MTADEIRKDIAFKAHLSEVNRQLRRREATIEDMSAHISELNIKLAEKTFEYDALGGRLDNIEASIGRLEEALK